MKFIEQQLRVFCIWICIALNPAFCVETDSESIETISEDEAMSFPSHPLASFCYVSGTSSSIIYNLSLVCLCLCRCVYRYIVIDSYKLRIVCSVSSVEFDWFGLMILYLVVEVKMFRSEKFNLSTWKRTKFEKDVESWLVYAGEAFWLDRCTLRGALSLSNLVLMHTEEGTLIQTPFTCALHFLYTHTWLTS